MGEPFRYVGGGQDQKERNQAPGYVHSMEAGGDVKGGAVGIRRKGEALVDELRVFGDLAADEEGPHEEGDDEPASQFFDVPTLSGEYTQLTGNRTQYQDRGVKAGEGDVENLGFIGPQFRVDRPHSEIHGKERRKEHEFAGEPDNCSDGDHVGAIRRRMVICLGDYGCLGHGHTLADR